MYCVCFQIKSSKMVHSLMRDRRMNAYGVRLKSHFNSFVLTDATKCSQLNQTLVTFSSDSFEDSLRKCL